MAEDRSTTVMSIRLSKDLLGELETELQKANSLRLRPMKMSGLVRIMLRYGLEHIEDAIQFCQLSRTAKFKVEKAKSKEIFVLNHQDKTTSQVDPSIMERLRFLQSSLKMSKEALTTAICGARVTTLDLDGERQNHIRRGFKTLIIENRLLSGPIGEDVLQAVKSWLLQHEKILPVENDLIG